MAFTVEFSRRASQDIDEIVAYIQADSPVDATRWRQELLRKLRSVRTMPQACGIAPENDHTRCELRQLLHGRYRVLFTIQGDVVYILSIRHGARRFMAADDIDGISNQQP